MAVITGGYKSLTRARFNDALGFNRLTDDGKLIKDIDLYGNEVILNNGYRYDVTVLNVKCPHCGSDLGENGDIDEDGGWFCAFCGQSSNPSHKCHVCKDIDIMSSEDDSTWNYTVVFSNTLTEPSQFNSPPYWMWLNSGNEWLGFDALMFTAYSKKGNVLFEQEVGVHFVGYDYGSIFSDISVDIDGISFTSKKSDPCTECYIEGLYQEGIAGISQGGRCTVNATSQNTTIWWPQLTLELNSR